jgi:hypothetical protein
LPVKSVLGADEVTLFGAAAGDQRGDGDQTAFLGASSGRFQMSPTRTSSVSDTSVGAESPMIF